MGSQTEREEIPRNNFDQQIRNLASPTQGYPPRPQTYNKRSPSTNSLSFTSDLKEPDTCSIEQLHNYTRHLSKNKSPSQKSEENEMIKIADDFLKNPFTSFLSREPSTVPVSPEAFTSNLTSPTNRFGTANMQYKY